MSDPSVFGVAQERYLNAYHGVLVAGSIGHFILFIITIFSKRVHRNILLLQFYALFSSILWFDAILLWTGHKSSYTEEIPPSIRVINATVRGTGMIMNSCSSLTVTLRIWSTVNTAKATSSHYLKEYIDSPLLLLIPWLFGIPFFIAHIIASLRNTDDVVRTPYFCVVLNAQLNLATVVSSTVIMFLLMVMALWTSVLLIRLRLSQFGLLKFRLSVDIQLISRIVLFLYYSITSLVVLLKATIEFQGFKTGPTLTFAATGLVACITFFIQADVLRVFSGCLSMTRSQSSQSYTHTAHHTPSSDPLIPPQQAQTRQTQSQMPTHTQNKQHRLSLSVFLPPKARLKSDDKFTRQSASIGNTTNTASTTSASTQSTQSFPLLPL